MKEYIENRKTILLMGRELTLGALALHNLRLQEAAYAKAIHGGNAEHILSSLCESSELEAGSGH